MNKIFRRLPFPLKLLIIGLIPLAFLIIISVQLHQQRSEKIAVVSATTHKLQRAIAISELIDQLQSERRYSFFASLTNKDNGTLAVQRAKTDEAIQKIEDLEGSRFKSFKNYTFLDRLPQIRQMLDNKRLSSRNTMDFYSNAIFRINTLALFSTSNLPFLSAANGDVVGQRLLSQMATYLGILRANVYFALYTGQFSERDIEELRSSNEIYHSYIAEFLQRSSPASVAAFKNLLSENNLKQTNSYINRIAASGSLDTTMRLEQWLNTSEKAVDNIKTLQRNLITKAENEVNRIYGEEQDARNKSFILLIVIIALVLFIVSITVRSISESLLEIKNAALRIASGAGDVQLNVPSRDSIGSLAESIKEIDHSNKKFATAAAAIGDGQFDVPIHPRSKQDILGNALVKMQRDLRDFNSENQSKIWIQTGLNAVNLAIQGDRNIESLTQKALTAIIQYLKAAVGVFYVSYEYDGLYLSATYGVADASRLPRNVAFGDTLVGQTAANQTRLYLTDSEEHQLQVTTAVTNSRPRHLLLIPLVHNGEVEGVMELASLTPFPSNTEVLLDAVTNNLAIALQAAKSKTRLEELLQETQAQAEELQAQHSELENLNTELEAQAQKLQASEEELKVQQEELLQSNQELEERSRLLEERNQQIAERNMEIQQKARELEQSTRYKSEFLANMSHELRTPLNSILLLSRLLSENNEQNLSEEQVSYAQVIQSSGNGLLALIDEILDLSKIEAGKMELEFQPVSLKEVAHEMKQLFEPVAMERQIEFNISLADGLPEIISTDTMRLQQILRNLISNALKFTAKGSVSLRMQKAGDHRVAFIVQDTGIGIPQDKQAAIFEAFMQADGSTRRKFGGTGLGLSISRELAKLLGGKIELKSEPGEGSEFTLILPEKKQEADVEPATQPLPIEVPQTQYTGQVDNQYISSFIPEPIPDDRKTIKSNDKSLLIVEDDTAFAKALMEYARSKGYKSIVCVRGDEAIKLARQFHPVGILLDIQLPVQSGWEVMDQLKSDAQTRHIPVHIMSSHTVKKESLQKGAIDFINKPVAFEKMQEIFNKIEHVIRKESRKVLIIEENEKHAHALAYFLSTFDVAAEVKNNLTHGVDALQNEDVDCVILDMGIPDNSSYKALEKIKAIPGLEQLPIIVFTGKNLSKAEEERLRLHTDSIVVKTAHSYQRILDEVTLFLHLVEQNSIAQESKSINRLGNLHEVLRGKTVLLTDDDVRNIFSLTRALEACRMNVLSATDGKEALNMLEQHPEVDVVLMDIMMPEMDGYQTMKQIRKIPRYKNLPIIAVTAKAMVGDREKCIQAGASDYISKPVDVDQLLSLLRVWLYDRGY